jgi:hypothetical protein
MTVVSRKQDLKNLMLDAIQNNKENYSIVSLYRELLVFNDKIRIYLSTDQYEIYINELYNIMDTYLYGNDDTIINNSINQIHIIINNL